MNALAPCLPSSGFSHASSSNGLQSSHPRTIPAVPGHIYQRRLAVTKDPSLQACVDSSTSRKPRHLVTTRALEQEEGDRGATAISSTATAQPSKPRVVDALFHTRRGTSQHKVWRVRPYAPSDFAALVQLQTDSFHTPLPLPVLDKLAKMSLRAEVLDGLRQKERHSNPESYVVLVADDVTEEVQQQGIQGEMLDDVGLPQASNADRKVQAVAEVMRENEREVLSELEPGTREYTYISSMAVAEGSRRRGLASAVLSAAEQQSGIWGQPHVALHVYEDNEPAIRMYTKMGMQVLQKDPFLKKILGGRIRLLMYKYLDLGQSERW
uniref:N-acetyltransferase domain-containing protein n=1 Tax=Dunaliella tertiolecta TaxID=3047 RepID=A0A7S3QN39_DUNTE|mmetsp:Transcript_14905/g.39540  ORF Transcript_14905/g.39540 Transcript_14905/m.39540 type:complete len:324 (+) Transcript_14905:57-1028(+)